MLYSSILLSLASSSLALVPFPIEERAIGGSCSTPVDIPFFEAEEVEICY